MRPMVNMLEEDRATDTGNMHKKLVKIALVVPEAPFTRYNLLSNRLSNRFDNRLYRVYSRLSNRL